MARILTPAEVLTKPLPPVTWVVEPLVAEGEQVMIVGESGAMKSWLMLHLGLHLAAGHDWLGHRVRRPYRVLYIDEEMGTQGAWGRLWMLAKGLEGVPQPENLPLALTNRAYFRSRDQHRTKTFMEWVKSQVPDEMWPPEIVMFDTMRAIMVGSENHSENVADFWDHLSPLLETATGFVTHHMSKPEAQESMRSGAKYRARGSGRIIEHPDVVFAMTRPNPKFTISKVEHLKSREAQESEPFVVELYHPTGDPRSPAVMRLATEPEQAMGSLPYSPMED